MNEIELAYLAGLFDGEGTISLRKRKSDGAIIHEVVFTNTVWESINFFHDLAISQG